MALTTTAGAIDPGGLTGWVLDVVRALGEVGIGLLVLVENLVPPIPSEVVLPFSGALVSGGRFTFAAVLLASTAGSVLGALLLYELGRHLGHDRVVRGLARIPLVEHSDLERGTEWFRRHGPTAVLTGRVVPGIRSVVSVPAGVERMPRGRFLALTTAGTATWNALLVGAGVLLGRRWQDVADYTRWLDVAMLIAVAWGVVRLVQRHRTDDGPR